MTRLRLAASITIVLASCNLFERLRSKPDAGDDSVEPKIDKPVTATSDASRESGSVLAALLGLDPEDEPVEADAGCPVPVHPGYCRRRCKPLSERKAFPHAQRIWPSSGVAFGKCGAYDVFSEVEPDGGGVTEYFDKTGALVAAVDTRQKCGKYGSIPTCTPALAWDAGWTPAGLGSLDPKK